MVALIDSKVTECRTCCCQSLLERSDRASRLFVELTFGCCSAHPQHEDFHGHRSLAILLSIDVRNDSCVVRKVCWLCHVCNAGDSRVVIVVGIKRRSLITPRKVDRFEPVESTMLRVKSSMILNCGYATAESLTTMSCIALNPVQHAELRKWLVERLMDLALDVLHPVFATLYIVPFLKLLGVKIGKRAEASTARSLQFGCWK